jgi:hypothetical protein
MAKCEVCGNDHAEAFQVTVDGCTHTFDTFECAYQALGSSCPHCGCHVVGHGVEASGTVYCSVECARQEGERVIKQPTDRELAVT